MALNYGDTACWQYSGTTSNTYVSINPEQMWNEKDDDILIISDDEIEV